MTFLDELRQPIYVTHNEIASQVSQMISEIKENGQQNGRTDDMMAKHVYSGCILETGFAKAVGGKINRKVFDRRDPDTYAYDVSMDDIRFEVKPTRPGDTWFNFNVRDEPNYSENKLSRADLSTFFKVIDYVDYMVVGYHEKVSPGKWQVFFKWLIVAETFERYKRRSNPQQTGTSNYYHIKEGIRNGQCFEI